MTSSAPSTADTETATNGKVCTVPTSQSAPCQYFLTGTLEWPFALPNSMKAWRLWAVLLTQANKYVSKTTLMKEIWKEEPPATADSTLYNHVGTLRGCLGEKTQPADKQMLQSKSPEGYRLLVDPSQVDVLRFMSIVKPLHLYGDESDEVLRKLLRTLDGAFPIIRGDALPGIDRGPILDGWIQEFNEVHRRAKALWVEAALKLRLFSEVASFLLPHLLDDPLYEDFARWCMLALYCSDRTGDALVLYPQLRAAMIEQFGANPGPRTRALHSLILRERREPLDSPLTFI